MCKTRVLVVLGVVLLPVFAGCSGDETKATDVQDTSAADSTPDLSADLPSTDVTDTVVPPDTAPQDVPPDSVQPSQPKAFLIQDSADLLKGPQAVGRLGDFRIQNDRIEAVIGAADHALWAPYGGGILDLAPAGDLDHFEEQFPMTGFLRSLKIETIEVAQDGTSGEAIIRVTGTDGPIPLVASLVPVAPVGVNVVVDYVLKADSDCLEIRTTISNPKSEKMTVAVGDALLFSETGKTVGPGAGFDVTALINQDSMEWLGADDPDMSFLLTPPKGSTMKLALTQDEMTITTYDSLKVFPGSQETISRCIYPIKGRILNGLAGVWEAAGVALVPVTGNVLLETDGYDFTRMSLEIRSDGKYVGSTSPDSSGALNFKLPKGDYEATLSGPGVDAFAKSFSLTDDQIATVLDLDPPDPGRVDVQILDAANQPFASRIIAQKGTVDEWGAARVALIPDLAGKATLFLPAGAYTVQGSRGAEFGFCRAPATVAAGEVVAVSCNLTQELSMPGWVAADLHVHSEFGIDSQLDRYLRVKAEVAEGITFWAATDHDLFEDYAPIVAELGLTGYIVPSVGIEVSPIGRHFNGLGCKPLANQFIRYFVIPWTNFLPNGEVSGARLEPDLWKTMHEEFQCRMVQVNHPRDGQGFFDLVNYDPAVGPSSAKPGRFDLTFDSMEIWNSSDNWQHLASKTLLDWYSFLNRGRRIIAVGNPDTHALTQWASQPHNLVMVDGTVTETSFYDAMLAGKAQVTSAPFIEFTIDGAELGDTVIPATSGTPMTAHIRVSAPSWAPLEKVQLIGNGQLINEWGISGLTDVTRLDDTFELTPSADTWYVVLAFDASHDMTPVYPGRTCAAVTNPIWTDLQGDGFDAPIGDE